MDDARRRPPERLGQLAELMDGYQEFHDFDPRQLALIEGLRALRLIHYSAWLARRWDDPAFPPSFPGSAPSATGASRSSPCASSARHWTRSRCGCSEPGPGFAAAPRERSRTTDRQRRRPSPTLYAFRASPAGLALQGPQPMLPGLSTEAFTSRRARRRRRSFSTSECTRIPSHDAFRAPPSCSPA
ncbi:hypothetical protein ACFSHR_19730 [Azotobacter chroococcum]